MALSFADKEVPFIDYAYMEMLSFLLPEMLIRMF